MIGLLILGVMLAAGGLVLWLAAQGGSDFPEKPNNTVSLEMDGDRQRRFSKETREEIRQALRKIKEEDDQ